MKRLATCCGEDTDLHQAAYVGDVKELTRFLQRPSAKTQINMRNRLGCTPLRLAASSESLEIESFHNANFAAARGTGGCHYDSPYSAGDDKLMGWA